MPRISAGILLYRKRGNELQVLLVHPGGPLWRNRDQGAWSIPKGEPAAGEDLLRAAQREFAEELGLAIAGDFRPLRPIRQKGGKIVHAWAVEGEIDLAAVKSNRFEMNWPPGSGRRCSFPEVDRAEFFNLPAALQKINPAQAALLMELAERD